MLRAAITTMQACAETLAREQSLQSLEDEIASVKEIFRLQGASELQDAEDRYLPRQNETTQAVILAASQGRDLGTLTDERPKTMVEVRGQPLLGHIVGAYNAAGIKDITVVRGFRPETVNLPALNYVDNAEYADTSELLSLHCALEAGAANGDLYVSFGDVIFRRYILDNLAEVDADYVIAVDTDWSESVNRERAADYVRCSEPHSRRAFYHDVTLAAAGEDLPDTEIHGEWMGILRVSAGKRDEFAALVAELLRRTG